MKKYNCLLYVIAILATISCDSILDKGPMDEFTNKNFWTNANNIEGYANAFYNEFTAYGNGTGGGNFYFTTLSDDQASNGFADWGQKNATTYNSTWRSCYEEIRRANIMIDRVKGMSSIDEKTKNHWLGVAQLMRAWEYYHLVRMFGDVPYTQNPLDITDEGVLYGPRTNRDEVMNEVLNDLNFACENIFESSSKTTWSRNLAQAMKAEISLYEGTFRKYRSTKDEQPAPDPEGAKLFLQETKKACQAIMNGDFQLNDSYIGNYNSISLEGNKEMIFYKAYKESVLTHSLIAYTCTSTQISGINKDAFDAYLFKDGKPLALTSLDNSDEPTVVDGKLSLVNILERRDKRLRETIDPILIYQDHGYERFPGDMLITSSTGYGIKKYDNGTLPLKFRNQTGQNYTDAPLFWLAQIYLNYAEACAELGTITQQDLDQSINLLRDRAEIPHLTVEVGFNDPANNHNVSSLIWEIRRERRCELICDNNIRYWDLIRWHQLDKMDSSKYQNILLGGNVSPDPTPTVEKIGNYIDASKGKVRTFDKKYYLYPIPSGQIDLNEKLKPNNPGW